LTRETESAARWYAVRTRPRHEKVVAEQLATKGYAQLLPQYRTRKKWADRLKDVDLPLFPGYVFCEFDAYHRVPVLNTLGVIDVVRSGKELAPVDEDEIRSLKTVMNSGLTCIPWTNVTVGQRVTIGFGPLAGVIGTVVELKQGWRLVLSVSLLNRHVLAEVDLASLAPLERPVLSASAGVFQHNRPAA
jgi:transcription antitermination factor NusG